MIRVYCFRCMETHSVERETRAPTRANFCPGCGSRFVKAVTDSPTYDRADPRQTEAL
jgi:DNA-directed RNA polymerase subunit RPC12/RpoP